MNIASAKIKRSLLLLGDLFFLYTSLWLTLVFRYGINSGHARILFSNQNFIPFSIIYFFWLIIFYISDLYNLNIARNNINFYSMLFKALLIDAAFAIAFFYFIPFFGITPKTVLFLNIALFGILFIIWRQVYNQILILSPLINNVLIIGETKETKELIKHIEQNPQLGFRIKKVVGLKEVELIFDLIEIIVKEKIQTVVTAIDPHKDVSMVRNLYQCLPLDITLYELPSFYEKITGKVPISAIEEIWFLENLMMEKKRLYDGIKRVIDIFYAIIIGLVALPLFPLIAMAIKIDTAGPVFYKQKRVGQNSQIFNLFKFRSMVDGAEKNGAQWAQVKDPRVTQVGNLLRATRLDELPQLFNILRGDMSFVGPRPERPEFVFGVNLQRQIPFYQIRHLVKPGLTGWAQINFRYGASLEDSVEKLQYDLFYIKNHSFILDLQIALKTIKIVLSGRGS